MRKFPGAISFVPGRFGDFSFALPSSTITEATDFLQIALIVREKLFRLKRRNMCVIARISLWHGCMSSYYCHHNVRDIISIFSKCLEQMPSKSVFQLAIVAIKRYQSSVKNSFFLFVSLSVCPSVSLFMYFCYCSTIYLSFFDLSWNIEYYFNC